jgi:hypothetical protein
MPETMKKIMKTTAFVRRDLLAAFLYFNFTSSASLDGMSVAFCCDASEFGGSGSMLTGASACCKLCTNSTNGCKNLWPLL